VAVAQLTFSGYIIFQLIYIWVNLTDAGKKAL